MNYFAHGERYLDDPYFLAGTAVPDWLNVVDRKVRARSKAADRWVNHVDASLAAVARGVMQHHRDDHWFHQTRAFLELQWSFTVELRQRLADQDGLRPSFLGHILVELLLDSVLIERDPRRLDAYYHAMEQVDPDRVREAVERISGKEVPTLPRWIPRFCAERFLYDYSEDGKLLGRLNSVMRRVGLRPLPPSLLEWFPEARQSVARLRDALLTPPEV
jgi:hypothetical protein